VDRSKSITVLRFPNKSLRARAISRHVHAGNYSGVVVFTCGNAATALRKVGLPVLEIGPQGTLNTGKWWTPAEVHFYFPNHFDATSGHLPLPLLADVAWEFMHYLDADSKFDPAGQYYVPTGSGETIIALHMAFPKATFIAVYDNTHAATTRDPEAPLNQVVDALFKVEYWNGTLEL
jgi:hypothetical protein